MRQGRSRLRRGVLACFLLATPAGAYPEGGSTEVQSLAVSLKSPEVAVRASAARILGELGGAARPALPDLIATLADESRDVRQSAATSIGQVGPPAPEAVPPLVGLLKDREWQVRRAAAVSLGRLQDKSAEEPLKAARKDTNKNVKDAAKRSLDQLKKVKKK